MDLAKLLQVFFALIRRCKSFWRHSHLVIRHAPTGSGSSGPSEIIELLVAAQPLTDLLWSVWIQVLQPILDRPLFIATQPLTDPSQICPDPGALTHPGTSKYHSQLLAYFNNTAT